MKRIPAILFFVIIVFGCDESNDAQYFVRLKNDTDSRLDNIKVAFNGEEKSYGAVETQRYSMYKSFNSILDPRINAMTNNEVFTNPLILSLWGGAPPDPGKYTCTLSDLDTALHIFHLQVTED